jgi:cytochrome c oxidase cbb3-type subunit 3
MRVTVLILAVMCLLGAIVAQREAMDARLLRADPDALTTDATLVDFAREPGRLSFEAHCARCHGIRGTGDAAGGIPDLSDGDWLYGSGAVAGIEQIIEYGIRSNRPKAWNLAIMPAYATAHPSSRDAKLPPLAPGDIRDVIEFLMMRQGSDADANAAARGAEIYRGRGGCSDCHAPDAKGDAAIGAPNLTDRVTLYGDGSRQALAISLSYGRQGVCPSWVERLSPADIRKIAVYTYSLSHRGARARASHE